MSQNICILSIVCSMYQIQPLVYTLCICSLHLPHIYSILFICIFVSLLPFPLLQQYSAEQQFIQTTDNLVATRTSLRLQLQSSHFHGSQPSQAGGLTLKCIAEIPNLYYLESSELELGVPQRDPIPARGKLYMSSIKFKRSLHLHTRIQTLCMFCSFNAIVQPGCKY